MDAILENQCNSKRKPSAAGNQWKFFFENSVGQDSSTMYEAVATNFRRESSTIVLTYTDKNFPQVHSKQSTTSRLFNLWTFLTMQLFTYKDVSVSKFSHMKCVCLQRVPKFLTFYLDQHVSTQCVYYDRFSCACSHTKRPVSAHFLSYEVISMRNVKHMTPFWSPNFS